MLAVRPRAAHRANAVSARQPSALAEVPDRRRDASGNQLDHGVFLSVILPGRRRYGVKVGRRHRPFQDRPGRREGWAPHPMQ